MSRVSWFLCSAALATMVACGGGEGEAAPEEESWEGDIEAVTRTLRPQDGTDRDWEVFRASVSRAWEAGLDTLPMGEAVVRIGQSFVGWPYGPGTLEVAGEEGVVVNFEEFDCVTLVENALALARFIKTQEPTVLTSELRAREAYKGAIREIRYRRGRVDGYPSRLHYFSDWILDNEGKGLVKEMTREFGGEEDSEAIDFMSAHPEAYRQLANPANYSAIMDTESRLSGMTRFKIPEAEIPLWVAEIQNGDIIAATSTVEGLDVAHTGLAYWQGLDLHLLHAPLVGESVEVSRLHLAERILRLSGQDGIRVVRPLEVVPSAGGSPKP
ncbi:MAG: DUF1460 domain-containing protein [Gemmatimonadetes bacterium]|nr:DUF1460 domain-containing protein [Gemmatimonadota bacterium]NNM03529.1 DUF1460 domain-containing protein [Gemmatimonadota bacterium]